MRLMNLMPARALIRAPRAFAAAAAVAALFLCGGGSSAEAAKKLSVITTTSDLASITSMIGGDRVRVESLTKGYQDPHFVDAKPSYLVKLRKADIFIQVGRDLEVAWVPGLLNAARNSRIRPGGPGFVDASQGVKILETGARGGREMGDVHPLGNPHYWLDPENGATIAGTVRDALTRAAPSERSYFQARFADFERELKTRIAGWKKRADALDLDDAKAGTYHRSWSYWANAFGVEVVGYVEPRPGVPPPPRHIQELTARMKSEGARLLIVEPYFDPKLPRQVARNARAAFVVLPPSVGAVPAASDYFRLFDAQLDLIQRALAGGGT